MKYASRIEAELLAKALADKRDSEKAATAAFKAVKVSIEFERKQKFASAGVTQRAEFALKIAERKKTAARAQAALQSARLKVHAAQLAWQVRIRDAKLAAKTSSEELRVKVMARISQGAEAARIQAEAWQRAMELRDEAYAAAMKRANAAFASIQIQEDAIYAATSLQTKNSLEAAEAERKANADAWMGVHNEAYGKYTTKTPANVELDVTQGEVEK